MIALAFGGWAEVRLATDPDPSDEPRGVSGWTFAIAGEPDLDRVIRLQPAGAVARKPGPQIGVAVRKVSVDGAVAAGHPLVGAAVDLLDKPVFEGRNGIVGEDAHEPIVPFHILVSGPDGVHLQREHRAPDTGALLAVPPIGPAADAGPDIATALGDLTPAAFRAQRRLDLQAAHDQAADEVTRVALSKRMRDIDDNVGDGIGEGIMGAALRYAAVMRGPFGEVRDPAGALGGTIALDPSWTADLWFGAFDGDALCMFVKGKLELPFAPA